MTLIRRPRHSSQNRWCLGLVPTTQLDRTEDATRLLRFSSAFRYPFLRLVPGFVEREQARLTATLDQLVRLRDELS